MSCHGSSLSGERHPEFLFSIPRGFLSSVSDGQYYWKKNELLVSPEVQCFPVFYVGL